MYLGIDLGTSSVKIQIINEELLTIFEVSSSYPLIIKNQNHIEQDPLEWINAIKKCLNQVKNELLSKVKSVSFSGQMHGLVLLDEKNEVLRNAILWNDQRTSLENDYLNNIIGKKFLLDNTGNISATGFTASKILWVKNNEPEIFNMISKILLPKDYISFWLTKKFFTDYSDASGTLYFDVKNKKWSQKMLDVLTIKEAQLPQVVSSNYVVGNIIEEVGFSKDCLVVIGGGDNAVSAVGLSLLKDLDTLISLGTSGVIYVNKNEYVKNQDGALHLFCNAINSYTIMGVTLAAASSLNWWKNIVGDSFELLLEKIDDVKNEVIFLPYLSGERTPLNNPNAVGSFYNLTIGNSQKDLTKAVLEGVAFSFKDVFSSLKNYNIKIKKSYITGGGSKNDVWVQMISDVLNIELIIIDNVNSASYGAALIAYSGLNNLKEIIAIEQPIIKVVKPNKNKQNYYNNKFKSYKNLVSKLFD